MDDDELRDPDEDDLLPEVRLHDQPLFIEAVDTGERYRQPITRALLGTAFADTLRLEERDDAT